MAQLNVDGNNVRTAGDCWKVKAIENNLEKYCSPLRPPWQTYSFSALKLHAVTLSESVRLCTARHKVRAMISHKNRIHSWRTAFSFPRQYFVLSKLWSSASATADNKPSPLVVKCIIIHRYTRYKTCEETLMKISCSTMSARRTRSNMFGHNRLILFPFLIYYA